MVMDFILNSTLLIGDSIVHHNWLQFVNDETISAKHRYKKYINIGWADEDWSIAGAAGKFHILMAFESKELYNQQ